MSKTQVHSNDVEDKSLKNVDIADDAAIEVAKLASVESTIIGRKTGGTANVHLTGAEALAILGLSKDWSRTDIDNLSILSLPAESTAWNSTASYMMNAAKWGWSGIYGYSDGKQRTIGTLTSIGATTTTTADDWTAINGKYALITAKDGSWFNIKNNGTAGTDCRKIYTNQDMDVNGVTQALFVYDATYDAWFLVSYAKKNFSWNKRIALSAIVQRPAGNETIWTFPASPNVLPYVGLYQVDVFVRFAEYSSVIPTVVTSNTLEEQTLSAKKTSDLTWTQIGGSHTIGIAGTGAQPMLYNHTLQGSMIVEVDSAKTFDIRLYLPNGIYNEVFGGYVHIEYLDINEGVY